MRAGPRSGSIPGLSDCLASFQIPFLALMYFCGLEWLAAVSHSGASPRPCAPCQGRGTAGPSGFHVSLALSHLFPAIPFASSPFLTCLFFLCRFLLRIWLTALLIPSPTALRSEQGGKTRPLREAVCAPAECSRHDLQTHSSERSADFSSVQAGGLETALPPNSLAFREEALSFSPDR